MQVEDNEFPDIPVSLSDEPQNNPRKKKKRNKTKMSKQSVIIISKIHKRIDNESICNNPLCGYKIDKEKLKTRLLGFPQEEAEEIKTFVKKYIKPKMIDCVNPNACYRDLCMTEVNGKVCLDNKCKYIHLTHTCVFPKCNNPLCHLPHLRRSNQSFFSTTCCYDELKCRKPNCKFYHKESVCKNVLCTNINCRFKHSELQHISDYFRDELADNLRETVAGLATVTVSESSCVIC